MHVVLTGASGLIGTALQQSLLDDGHQITRLVRGDATQPGTATWHPEQGTLDPAVLDGTDAVVCLSGAGVGDHRWTDSYKQTLRSSRTDSVGTVSRVLAALPSGPRVLVSASAVGYYGDTGDTEVVEATPPGRGFLSDLCVEWEAATAPAQAAGLRVAHLRTGLVLARQGGLLARLRPIVKLGVAGRLGTGRQFMPWISLLDEVRAIRFVLEHDLAGPLNLTGPAPVRNEELISTLARLLHRPAVLPTPAFALRAVLGEFAQDTLTGQRAIPAALAAAGFEHRHADVESALRWALAD